MEPINTITQDDPIGHDGELVMRELFPSRYQWNENSLRSMINSFIPIHLSRFIESQPFFFISTANAQGHCDCSFRGQELDINGDPLPALKVLDQHHLVFPDFPGNGLYNSLGNIHTNPHIGMLFMDFSRQQRARINGLAQVKQLSHELQELWPTAQCGILVTVEQVYGNCPARIPRLLPVHRQ